MTAKKPAASRASPKTKTSSPKEVKSGSAATARQTKIIKGGIVRSKVDREAMASPNPFQLSGTGPSSSQLVVSFASEDGRRGKEIYGLGGGPISTTILNSTVARKRSRYAVLTNPYAKRAVDVWVSNIVGSGHSLVSECGDKVFKKQVEDLWNEWIEQVDVTGKLSLSGMEALACRSMLEGGDCFIRMRVRRVEDGLVVPLQLQIYESEQVPVTKNEQIGQNRIIAGIEFGTFGQILNYHMYRSHPGEMIHSVKDITDTGLDTVPIPAADVIHLHDVRRPNEVRGLPILCQSLIQLSDLDRYLDAELVRKKAAALIGGFIRRPNDDIDGNPFVTGDGEEGTTEEVQIEALEPGTFPVLPPGYEVSFSNPADVGPNFSAFLKQMLLMLATSVNLTYEQLSGDPSQGNDRTIRATMLEFKRIAEQYQKNIIQHQFCRAIFHKWFDLALLSGALTLPPGMTKQQARKVRWISDPWDYLNPQQEVNTQIAQVRAGFIPRSEIITQRGGVPEDVDNQFKVERDREANLDLVFTSNAGVVSNAGVAQSTDPSVTLKEDGEGEEDKAPKQQPFGKGEDDAQTTSP